MPKLIYAYLKEKYNGVFSLVQENDIVKSVVLIPIKN